MSEPAAHLIGGLPQPSNQGSRPDVTRTTDARCPPPPRPPVAGLPCERQGG